MAKTIARLNIHVASSGATLTRDLNGMKGAVNRFDRGVRTAAGGMNTFNAAGTKMKAGLAALTTRLKGAAAQFLAVAAAATAGIAGIRGIARAFTSIDQAAKLGDRIGSTTEALQGLRLAAELSGAGTATLDKSLENFVRRLGEAQQGTGEAVKGLEKLGLSATELAAMAPAEAFAAVADKIRELPTPAEKAAAAYQLFGRQGVQLLNTLELGSQGLADVQAQAERLGHTFNRVDAAKVEAANDAVTRMKSAFGGVATQLAIALAPALEHIADRVTEFASALAEMIRLNRPAIEEFALAAAENFGLLIKALAELIELANKFMAALDPDLLRKAFDLVARFAMPIVGITRTLQGVPLGGAIEAPKVSPETALSQEAMESLADSLEGVADAAGEVTEEVDAAAEAMKKWEDIGRQLTEEFRTPLEEFEVRVNEINEALTRGVISWETYERAIADAVGRLDEAKKQSREALRDLSVPSVGSVDANSTAGFSAILEGQSVARQLAQQRDIERKENAERNRLLQQIRDAVIHKQPIDVKKIRI